MLTEGRSVAAFAQDVGLQHDKIRQWMKGGRIPTLREFSTFCRAARVHPLWLALGLGERTVPFETTGDVSIRISETCKNRNLNELARASGISRSSLELYAKGKGAPKLDKLIALASSTDHSFLWLLTGQGPERPFEGERRHKTQAHEPPFSEIRSQKMEIEAVRAEDIRLRRLIDTLKTAADGAPARVLGWLDPVFERMEREFVEELSRTFPEWAEKKWGTPHSDDGVA